jgi:hypothetical protein
VGRVVLSTLYQREVIAHPACFSSHVGYSKL